MTKNYFTLPFYGENYTLYLTKEQYCNNKRLAIIAFTKDDGEYWCDISVNLSDVEIPNDERLAFVDTNNAPWAEKFLVENEIAEPTGQGARSGFCIYPLYRFNLDKLEKSQL